MKKIGILVDNLKPSQLSYFLIRGLSQHLQDNPKKDGIVFCQEMGYTCVEPKFPLMQLNDGLFYDGTVISTCMQTTETLNNCVAAQDRFYYVWDLPWLRKERKLYDYFSFNRAFNSFKLIFRSQEHLECVKSCFNLRHDNLFLMENFKFSNLRKA